MDVVHVVENYRGRKKTTLVVSAEKNINFCSVQSTFTLQHFRIHTQKLYLELFLKFKL